MKKYIILLCAMMSVLFTGRAQKNDAPMKGIWQLFRPMRGGDGNITARFQPTWKIYNPDGSYFTFMWPPYEGKYNAFLTGKGAYRLQTDSTYVEHISYATMNPEAAGKQSLMDFHLINEGTYLALSYGNNGQGKKIGELWHRVAGADVSGKKSAGMEKLVGLWQYCVTGKADDGTTATVFLPRWKYLCADGSFATFVWRNINEVAQVSNQGTFTVNGDDAYTEEVVTTNTDPDLVNKKNTMNYRIEGDTMLYVSYTMPGQTQVSTETWVRVRPGVVNPAIAHRQGSPGIVKKDAKGIYLAAEQMPEFPGGQEAMAGFVADNLSYPTDAINRKVSGTTLVRFVVKKDGSVEAPTVIRSADPSLDKECVRVARLMKFTPAKVDGKAVDCYVTIPIKLDAKNANLKDS